MTWDGKDRRGIVTDHDRLIRMESKLDTLLDSQTKHERDDDDKFKAHGDRISKLEKALWTFIGIVICMEFILKIIK